MRKRIVMLGAGTQASVYSCIYNGQQAARKEFKYQEEYEDEVNILSQLSHPNIIQMIDHHDRNIYMPLFDGDIRKGQSSIGVHHRVLAKQMMNAIKYLCSKNISHSDIFPQNILYKKDGDNTTFVLCDFGFAQQRIGGFYNNVHSIDTSDPLAYIERVETLDLWDLAITIIRYLGKNDILNILTKNHIFLIYIEHIYLHDRIPDGFDDCLKYILDSLLKDEDPVFLEWIFRMMSTKTRFTVQEALNHSWIKE